MLTNTGYLTGVIEKDNRHEFFYNDKDKSNFSRYLNNSKFLNKTKKMVIDKIKDEAKYESIVEFVWLKSKMYSYIKQEDTRDKKKVKKFFIWIYWYYNETWRL